MRDRGDRDADAYLDCASCKRNLTCVERRSMHCGFEDEASHIGGGFMSPDGWPRVTDTDDTKMFTLCPGYSTTLPEVSEAARALSWAKRGSLRDFYDADVEITDQLRLAVDIVDSEIRNVERQAMRDARKGGDGPR